MFTRESKLAIQLQFTRPADYETVERTNELISCLEVSIWKTKKLFDKLQYIKKYIQKVNTTY